MKILSRALTALERHPRLNPGLRILMAIFGAYAVAALGAAALASGLTLPKSDAVTLAVILAFVLYLLLTLWVFASATLVRAALGLLAPVVLFSSWLTLGATTAVAAAATDNAPTHEVSPQTSTAPGDAAHPGQREGREGRERREGKEDRAGRAGHETHEARAGREGREGRAGRGGRPRAEAEPQ
ncbi:hypothetical protein FACS189497_06570 [Betaproteobacteria bacterium]|nr:hypothetical protein FACS189497_06570 [Betaproteobacteria bacterium]